MKFENGEGHIAHKLWEDDRRDVSADKVEFVRELLETLPEDRRDLLLEYMHSGLTTHQIAEKRGTTYGAYMAKKNEAMHLLKRRMDAFLGRTADDAYATLLRKKQQQSPSSRTSHTGTEYVQSM